MNDFFSLDYSLAPTNVGALLLGLLLAFLGGHLIAWIYMATHTGLSYSRTFVRSLVLIPSIVALVMTVLSNNLVTAFGLMAVFAIVRFRNILRDTLDTSYILAVIVVGMACGTMKFATAVVGCLIICGILVYLWATDFGSRQRYDSILHLHWSRPLGELGDLRNVLERHSLRVFLTGQRPHEGTQSTALSYRLLMRDPDRLDELLSDIRGLRGAANVHGTRAEEESEA